MTKLNFPADEIRLFRQMLNELINKALEYLMYVEWKEYIDKNVRIRIAIINEKEIHFELMQDMIGQLLFTKSFTWEEINNLEHQN